MSPSPRLTHFLSIPLLTTTSHPQLQTAFSAFTARVSTAAQQLEPHSQPQPALIPAQAIRPLTTLHLTLGVLSLTTPAQLQAALDRLQTLDLGAMLAGVEAVVHISKPSTSTNPSEPPPPPPPPSSPPPSAAAAAAEGKGSNSITITLRGLHPLQQADASSSTRAAVFYAAPLDPDLRLYRFCQRLRAAFAGLLVNEERPLLLHATVVNSVYLPAPGTGNGRGPGSGRGRGKGRRERVTFEVDGLVREYKDFEWMRGVRAERVALCKMGARRTESGDEEYVVEWEREMPV